MPNAIRLPSWDMPSCCRMLANAAWFSWLSKGSAITTAPSFSSGRARGFDKFPDEARHILAVDVVANLFALVAVDAVFAPFEIAFHEITQESVKLDARMVWSGKATTTQGAGGHAEISAIFLNHHIRRHLRGAKQRVLALVDGKILGDAVSVGRIRVIPAGLQFAQRNGVGSVAVDLVGRHANKW